MGVMKVNVSNEDNNFWNGLRIYYEQPKSINKQVLLSESIFNAELLSPLGETERHALVDNLCLKLKKDRNFKNAAEELQYLKLNLLTDKDASKVFLCSEGVYLLVRRLIPKLNILGNVDFYEFIFMDKLLSIIYIFTKYLQKDWPVNQESAKEEMQDSFVILKFTFLQINWCSKTLVVSYSNNLSEKGVMWLKATFVPKFLKLSKPVILKNMNNKLSLQFENKINILQYYQFYEKMKIKYGKYFVENWTEKTDPKKFVYEDIAIATYLLMLWNDGNLPDENVKKQKFVDLGCGNGLLVHILNSEGHLGVGLDIRKRNIWDIYPSFTVLKEETIIPSIAVKYPNADWLIGNHSDELTAWIPIMARLSNDHCQYFVLPCCPYELNGMKFQRKNTSLSVYQDFIWYVRHVSEVCGFETYVDKLRIPSTKRICLIGLNDPEGSEHKYNLLVESTIKFVEQECKALSLDEDKIYKSDDQASVNVIVRNPVEAVRNCTKLPQSFIDSVLKDIMSELLKENNSYEVIKDEKKVTWNRGGKLTIKELASHLGNEQMKLMKNECKGLQTLLRNHHFLFEVTQGFVQFRKPESLLEISKKFFSSNSNKKWKIKKCWFFNNHPDGCPITDDMCSYSHDRFI